MNTKETASDWTRKTEPVWQVYADGSSTGRANREGGYAWIVLKNGEPLYASYGGSPSTTNNLMELEGLIKGLEALLASELYKGEAVELCSDSQYALGIANGTYTPVKNKEPCDWLRELAKRTGAVTRWCRGHAGVDEWQERCDSLAKKGKEENVKPK